MWAHEIEGQDCGPHVDRKSTRLNSSHTVIYTLSLHDALPISRDTDVSAGSDAKGRDRLARPHVGSRDRRPRLWPTCRSEEHTSELQSHRDLHSFPTRRSSDLPRHGRLCRFRCQGQRPLSSPTCGLTRSKAKIVAHM